MALKEKHSSLFAQSDSNKENVKKHNSIQPSLIFVKRFSTQKRSSLFSLELQSKKKINLINWAPFWFQINVFQSYSF